MQGGFEFDGILLVFISDLFDDFIDVTVGGSWNGGNDVGQETIARLFFLSFGQGIHDEFSFMFSSLEVLLVTAATAAKELRHFLF